MRLIPSLISHTEPRASSPGTADSGVYVPGSTLWVGYTQGGRVGYVHRVGIPTMVYQAIYTGIYTTVHTLGIPPYIAQHASRGPQGVHSPACLPWSSGCTMPTIPTVVLRVYYAHHTHPEYMSGTTRRIYLSEQ